MSIFIIDTIVQFRNKYAIEANSLEEAQKAVLDLDSVDTEVFSELSQRFIGETIIDSKKISKKQFDSLIDDLKEDKNEMCSHWMGEKLIHKIKD